jgi:hypothetical protein
MGRALYRCLVNMHPPTFRREFAGEMLCIYEEAAQVGAVLSLFGDVLISLARQWFLRSGGWKIAVVLGGALFQVSIGGILWLSLGRAPGPSGLPADAHPELAAMMRLCTLVAVGLLCGVMFLVFWWRKLARRIGV